MASRPLADRNRVRAGRAAHKRSVPAQAQGSGGAERSDGVLLTGVTGFLGMELLVRLLEQTDRYIYALVRADSDRQAQARLASVARCLFGTDTRHDQRVIPVRGDITQPGLGLRCDPDALAECVNEIVHGAASVSFESSLDASRAINVEGTRGILELAQRCHARGGLRRFSYISTAYVAGDHQGCFSEDELDVGQGFRNAYEQSKFEAESLVASWRACLPVTVVRPSIVVGERTSGWTASFNVIYWPLRAFAHGAYRVVPARRDACLDAVPVDYVADAIFRLTQARETVGATFHVTAGTYSSSVGELIDLARRFFERPAPRVLEPSLYRGVVHPLLVRFSPDPRVRRTLKRSEAFFPYFSTGVAYDNRRCRAALCASDIWPAPLNAYFDRLVEFALAADWGKRSISRAQALARVAPKSRWNTIELSSRPESQTERKLVLVR